MSRNRMQIDWRLFLVNALATLLATSPLTAFARQPTGAIAEGQEIFNRRFVPADSPRTGGDGLGPMFHHVS